MMGFTGSKRYGAGTVMASRIKIDGRWWLGTCLLGLLLMPLVTGADETQMTDSYPRKFYFGVINLVY